NTQEKSDRLTTGISASFISKLLYPGLMDHIKALKADFLQMLSPTIKAALLTSRNWQDQRFSK
ncbi:MAG: hypothetical protein KAR15_11330, partial [Desulfobacterales bacterium]|nr:hypothetical protein [Desulfobacterales bacterium]